MEVFIVVSYLPASNDSMIIMPAEFFGGYTVTTLKEIILHIFYFSVSEKETWIGLN